MEETNTQDPVQDVAEHLAPRPEPPPAPEATDGEETDAADQEGGRSLRRPPTSRAPEESADQDGGRSVRFARAGCAPEESADQDGGRSAQRTPQNAAPAAPSRQRHKPAS